MSQHNEVETVETTCQFRFKQGDFFLPCGLSLEDGKCSIHPKVVRDFDREHQEGLYEIAQQMCERLSINENINIDISWLHNQFLKYGLVSNVDNERNDQQTNQLQYIASEISKSLNNGDCSNDIGSSRT